MFENAKFGDLYLTRDNKKAVFLEKYEELNWYMLHIEGVGSSYMYTEDGKLVGNHEESDWDEDIVSKL